jgi:hypothetical protein
MKKIIKLIECYADSIFLFYERLKSYLLRFISKAWGFSFERIETLIHGENANSSKFEILDRYSELENFSYTDYVSGELIGHTFQQSNHIKISNIVLDTKTGIMFTTERKLVSESSSWSPEYLVATAQTRPPRRSTELKVNKDQPLISMSSNGFYHWLNEDLPHYLYLREKIENPITVVSRVRPRFVSDFLESNAIRFIDAPRFTKCKELNFISNHSNVGWPHPKDVSIIRNHFKSHFRDMIPNKKVYISRVGESRSPSFERELVIFLANTGWLVLDTARMTLAEQIKEISSAEVLTGIHGAGLSGVNWMSKHTSLIEFGTDRFVRCYQRLAEINDVNYLRINYEKNVTGLSTVKQELRNLGLI